MCALLRSHSSSAVFDSRLAQHLRWDDIVFTWFRSRHNCFFSLLNRCHQLYGGSAPYLLFLCCSLYRSRIGKAKAHREMTMSSKGHKKEYTSFRVMGCEGTRRILVLKSSTFCVPCSIMIMMIALQVCATSAKKPHKNKTLIASHLSRKKKRIFFPSYHPNKRVFLLN